MNDSRHVLLERAAILAVATVVCAVLTFVTGVAVMHAMLAPNDSARGGPLFDIPVVMVGGSLCAVCAVIAYPLMLWGLVRTNLAKSLPVVFATAIGTIAATAGWLGPIGAAFSLVASAIVMGVCRKVFRDREVAAVAERTARRRGAILPLGFGAAAGMLLFPIACAVVAGATDGMRAIPASTILSFGVPIGACVGMVGGWCLAVAGADALRERDGR